MTNPIAILFVWVPLGVMAYNWTLFPALLMLAVGLKRAKPVTARAVDLPRVTIVIAAWNEELCIAAKIGNCLAFDYPVDRLEIVVGTDAITDRTNEIVRSFADRGVKLHAVDERLGKSAVLNMLIPDVHGDLVLLTDADVLMAPSALRLAVGRFSDEKVGVLLFHYQRRNEDGHVAEGLWDRYENWLKRLEGELGAAVLCRLVGKRAENLGRHYRYIESYAAKAKRNAVFVVFIFVKRCCLYAAARQIDQAQQVY